MKPLREFGLLNDINDTLQTLTREKFKIKKYIQGKKYTSYQLIVPKSKKEQLFKLFQTYFPLKNKRRIDALMPRAARLKI